MRVLSCLFLDGTEWKSSLLAPGVCWISAWLEPKLSELVSSPVWCSAVFPGGSLKRVVSTSCHEQCFSLICPISLSVRKQYFALVFGTWSCSSSPVEGRLDTPWASFIKQPCPTAAACSSTLKPISSLSVYASTIPKVWVSTISYRLLWIPHWAQKNKNLPFKPHMLRHVMIN